MPPYKDRYLLHLVLFVLTLASTILAGATMAGRELVYGEAAPLFFLMGMRISWPWLQDGLLYGGSLLLFLTVHEFGHYFAARFHHVRTSLPYYIPFPFNGIGTFGAVIRIRQPIPDMRTLFDIGAAGPIAGFVVAVGILVVGVSALPGPEYMMGVPGHEALKQFISRYGAYPTAATDVATVLGASPDGEGFTLVVGMTPLYWLITSFAEHAPPMWEMYHYPVLFAGWLGLFFTALNLLPVGQLDGGHILYALAGPKWHGRLARGFVLFLLLSGGLGFVDEASQAAYAWFPWLPGAPWVLLAIMMYLYLQRIFREDPNLVAPMLLVVTLIIALLSRIPFAVATFAYSGWLIWCLLIVVFIKVDHPPVLYMQPLSPARRWMAYAGMVIFVLCFSIRPLYVL